MSGGRLFRITCITGCALGPHAPDTGYVYAAGYGTTSDQFEAGFQYAPSATDGGSYVVYSKDSTLAPGQLNAFGSPIPCGGTVILNVYVDNSTLFGFMVAVVYNPVGSPVTTITPVPFYDWPDNAFGDQVARMTTIAQVSNSYLDGSQFGVDYAGNPEIGWSDSQAGVYPCFLFGWNDSHGNYGTQDAPEDYRVKVYPPAARYPAQPTELDGISLTPP